MLAVCAGSSRRRYHFFFPRKSLDFLTAERQTQTPLQDGGTVLLARWPTGTIVGSGGGQTPYRPAGGQSPAIQPRRAASHDLGAPYW